MDRHQADAAEQVLAPRRGLFGLWKINNLAQGLTLERTKGFQGVT
jgi:hypothetical protein